MDPTSGYLYLNLANEWPTFERHGLDIAPDGSLTLQAAGGVPVPRGVFRGGPFTGPGEPAPWSRLRVETPPLPEGTHVRLFTFTADGGDAPYDPSADEPFSDPGWRAAPRDVLDVWIANPPARRLWVGGLVHSDGRASPRLRQMRVDHGRDTYLDFLPAVYARDGPQRDFLQRFLALAGSDLGGLEQAIADLPRLFDPAAAPAGEPPSWLSWLAGWLAFDLDETWTPERARDYLSRAFALYGQRGTVEGLRRYLKWYAGVEARIEEPGPETVLWSLGETSTLGFTTRLAPAHFQGAVVGTTATLGQTHLSRADGLGAALFEDTAHRFTVHVWCAELRRPGMLEAVRAVLERDKPAHTAYHLCVIEPSLRVGAQARVGIDAIVAQGPQAAQEGRALDTAVLAERAAPCEK